ncbi:MAG: transketolase [Oscillospiraceae bacterium]|nr:transketolase [Oscillospiraceae bacterium]
MDKKELRNLEIFAAEIRLETIKEIGHRGFGHIGGALSVVEALAVLYGGLMNINPLNPNKPDRDKLIMSKGHAGPAVYATLALKGYFPMDWLETLNQPGTCLPSHCDRRLTPGIDMTTGSLGQGTSAAVGLAMAQRLNGLESYTYLFTGDGELNEGQCWEAAMFAPNKGVNNLVWLVDNNRKQLDGRTENVMDLGDVGAKFAAFGWHVQTVSGNSIEAVYHALKAAKEEKDKPSCIVMNTVKGAGAPLLEEIELNHHIVLEGELLERSVAHAERALRELKGGERA